MYSENIKIPASIIEPIMVDWLMRKIKRLNVSGIANPEDTEIYLKERNIEVSHSNKISLKKYTQRLKKSINSKGKLNSLIEE